MSQPMEWDELIRQAEALRADRSATAVGLAAQGAQLLHRALTEMYIGEPEMLRAVATAIARARPEVVALRNVGVSAYRTAREARSGDRMAAGARGVARLARLLSETPNALARRGQPLLLEGSTVVTLGRSRSVLAALALAGDHVQDVYVIRDAIPADPALDGATYRTHEAPVADTAAALDASNIVLLGCSAFLADGSMAADEGALALVEAAFSHDPPVPVHFFADTLKLAPWLPEPHDDTPSMDIVPPEHVDHVITEDGIRRPNQLLLAAADLANWWRQLENGADT